MYVHVHMNALATMYISHTHTHTHMISHNIYMHTVAPNFTVNPEDLLAVVGDSINLTCSAQATPPSNITWEFNNGTTIMNDNLFSISSFEGDVTTSVLSFVAGEDLASPPVLMFRCVATNDVGNATSDTATVTIQSKLSCA